MPIARPDRNLTIHASLQSYASLPGAVLLITSAAGKNSISIGLIELVKLYHHIDKEIQSPV